MKPSEAGVFVAIYNRSLNPYCNLYIGSYCCCKQTADDSFNTIKKYMVIIISFCVFISLISQVTSRLTWKRRTVMCLPCTSSKCLLPRLLPQLCQAPWQKEHASMLIPSSLSLTLYHTVFRRTGSGARKAFLRSLALLTSQV